MGTHTTTSHCRSDYKASPKVAGYASSKAAGSAKVQSSYAQRANWYWAGIVLSLRMHSLPGVLLHIQCYPEIQLGLSSSTTWSSEPGSWAPPRLAGTTAITPLLRHRDRLQLP